MRRLVGMGLGCIIIFVGFEANSQNEAKEKSEVISDQLCLENSPCLDQLSVHAAPEPEMGEGSDKDMPLGPLVLQLAEIKLENGNVVTFAEVADGSLLISEGGTASSSPVLHEYIGSSETPLQLARNLWSDFSASPEFEAASQRVAQAGNWRTSVGAIELPEGVSIELPLLEATHAANTSDNSWCSADSWAYNATFTTTTYVGHRAGNQGGVHWFLEPGHVNSHSRNDILAVKGKVCVTSGLVWWRLSRRNCTACNYYTIWDKTISANHWYYAFSYSSHNDFKFGVSSKACTQVGVHFGM